MIGRGRGMECGGYHFSVHIVVAREQLHGEGSKDSVNFIDFIHNCPNRLILLQYGAVSPNLICYAGQWIRTSRMTWPMMYL